MAKKQIRRKTIKGYDSYKLAVDIVLSKMTYKEIAEKHGLSQIYVSKLSRGERRPEIKELVDTIRDSFVERLRIVGSEAASQAMECLYEIITNDDIDPETKRKASVDILRTVIGEKQNIDINSQGTVVQYINVNDDGI